MPSLTLTSKNLTALRLGAILVAAASTEDGARLVVGKDFPTALRAQVEESAAALGITGAADEVRRVPSGGHLAAPVLVITGLGAKTDPYSPETLRRAAGAAVRELTGTTTVGVALPAARRSRCSTPTPWAHLDIAGPSFNEGSPHGYTPEGGTGVGVRTLLALLETRAR